MKIRDIRPPFVLAVAETEGEVRIDLDPKGLGVDLTNCHFEIVRFTVCVQEDRKPYCTMTLLGKAPGETTTVEFHNRDSVWSTEVTAPGGLRHAMPFVAEILQENVGETKVRNRIRTAVDWQAGRRCTPALRGG